MPTQGRRLVMPLPVDMNVPPEERLSAMVAW